MKSKTSSWSFYMKVILILLEGRWHMLFQMDKCTVRRLSRGVFISQRSRRETSCVVLFQAPEA